MKKLSVFLVTALIALSGLTSCLKGDNTRSGYGVGILTYASNYSTLVIKTSFGNFYGPELNAYVTKGQLEIDEYYYFYYTMDYDLPENSTEMVNANGYYTVSISPGTRADKYYAMPVLTDTSAVMTDEIPVLDVLYADGPFGYAESYLCMTHIVSYEKDLTVQWDMSYDGSREIMSEVNGKRYYNLFLRATVSGSNEGSTKTETAHFNAYRLREFLERAAMDEKSMPGYVSGSSTFLVKFNYVSDIKEDQITWSYKSAEFPINLFE
ncbi:MAG: hypothetical protein LBL07_08655 [Tannerella sp.]|jgi:hypothetical protein|nr:hypothetical protein [Tannerella sp.]